MCVVELVTINVVIRGQGRPDFGPNSSSQEDPTKILSGLILLKGPDLRLTDGIIFFRVQDFVNHMEAATLQSLYLQHNYLTNFGGLASASLPPSVAVCVQYNCMVPPPQSLCPPSVVGPASRPGYQCLKASGSPD